MNKQYKQIGGMSFDVRTPETVCNILAQYAGRRDVRLRLYYGDTETGRCWMEEHDTIGYIGRSTGQIKIPLLIKNSRSWGGGAILDNCIIKITVDGVTLYEHPLFNMPVVTVNNDYSGHGWQVLFDGEIYANCKTETQAKRLAAFMRGERNSK
jgi:hypothetical protein